MNKSTKDTQQWWQGTFKALNGNYLCVGDDGLISATKPSKDDSCTFTWELIEGTYYTFYIKVGSAGHYVGGKLDSATGIYFAYANGDFDANPPFYAGILDNYPKSGEELQVVAGGFPYSGMNWQYLGSVHSNKIGFMPVVGGATQEFSMDPPPPAVGTH
jgi:hypothetical protein